MINYSKPRTITAYFGEKWSKSCTVTALVLRICTAVILLATLCRGEYLKTGVSECNMMTCKPYNDTIYQDIASEGATASEYFDCSGYGNRGANERT
jgi:hypothetical protein